nr:phage tail tape measure protein [uncultured Draconibacterium sp.]
MSTSGGIQGLHFINTMSNAGLKAKSAEAESIIAGMGRNIGKLAPFAPLAAGGLILAKLGDQAHDFAREYEMAMKEVQTISEAVKDDFEGYSKEIIQMSANGTDTATELAQAYYQIVSAGYDGARGLDILRTSSELATGSLTSTVVAADALTSILNAYGDKAGSVVSISDKLFEVVKNGKITMEQLGTNIVNVTGLAAQAGVEINDLFAAYATGTKTLKPEEFTTGVRGVLTAIIKPTEEALGMASQLGIEFNSTALATKGLSGFLGELLEKTEGNIDALASLFPNVRGLGGVLAIAANDGKELNEQLQNLETSAGNTSDALTTMLDAVDNKWKVVSNKWNRELSTLGENIKSVSGGWADLLNALLTNEQDLAADVAPTVGSFQDRVAANKMLGMSNMSAWLSSISLFPSAANMNLESKLFDTFQQGQSGFGEKEGRLSTILGIEDAKQRAEELNVFLEQMKSERNSDIELVSIGPGGEAINNIRRQNWKDLIKLIEDAIKKAETFDKGGGGSGSKGVNEVTKAIKNLDELKKKLGTTGSIEQEVEIMIKIKEDEAVVEQFYQDVRERFEQAVNESWEIPINRTVGADGTNSKINTRGDASKLIEAQTQDIKGQLQPMKQLTEEQVKQKEAQFDKIDAQRTSEEQMKKEIEGMKTMTQIMYELNYIIDDLNRKGIISEANYHNFENTMMVAEGFQKIVTGDIVGGAATWVSAIISSFDDAGQTMTEFYENWREEIETTRNSIELANETLINLGRGTSTEHIDLAHRKLKEIAEESNRVNEQTANINYFGSGNWATELNWTLSKKPLTEYVQDIREEVDQLTQKLLYGSISDDQRTAIESALESANSMLEVIDTTITDLTGTSTNELADSMVEAFMAGEDAAEKWGETVDGVIKDVILRQLTATVLEEPINNALTDFVDNASDGIQENDIQVFANALSGIFEASQPAFEAAQEALEKFGIDSSVDSGYAEQGLQGISRSITEETGSLLVGQFYSMRESQVELNGTMLDQLAMAEEQLEVLEDIRDNTSYNHNLADIKQGIDDLNANIKTGLSV